MLPLQILKDEVQECQEEQQGLKTSTDRHLFDDDQQVLKEKKRAVGILYYWKELNKMLKSSSEKMLPLH